jgi:thiol-disulfide isomerase/thioredoxin
MSNTGSPDTQNTAKKSFSERLGRFEWLGWIALAVGFYFFLRPTPSGPKENSSVLLPPLLDVETGKLASLPKGKPVLVEVFASWCGACKRANSILSNFDRTSLDYVMVSVDDSARLALGAKKSWPIATPVFHDTSGALSREWKIEMLPTFVLLDESGRVLRVSSGIPGPLDLHAFSEATRERR